ncbi:tetraacyldisaccharide 4'-kinase [Flavobacterium aurantiibacter]|nr:tetraacyldisaccharide 4'-kinase [Flavobacterium aurantiibacter]
MRSNETIRCGLLQTPMKFLRFLLFPFAVIYGWITAVRNLLFDFQLLRGKTFDVPVISVGNLSVGGTGKTPHVEYLIRTLSASHRVAVLSRGYKRKSQGFVLASANSTVADLGDEPFQYHRKFPQIQVAVDANRRRGIELLSRSSFQPEIILLDDAFQHRYVKPDVQILLSTFEQPFFSDFLLPTGNLREYRSGAKRADLIVITKCPPDLNAQVLASYVSEIKRYSKAEVFFSTVGYAEQTEGDFQLKTSELPQLKKAIFTGIAQPNPFVAQILNPTDAVFEFADHHDLTESERAMIQKSADLVVTTEKDYVRVKSVWEKPGLCYLPIQVQFVDEANFLAAFERKFTKCAAILRKRS